MKKRVAQMLARWMTHLPPGLLARMVREMALTGRGTDACLYTAGCLPMLVHYYSPVPDPETLSRQRVWDRVSPLAGVDFRPADQCRLLADLGRAYGGECNWPATLDAAGGFHTENGTFSFACAASTHCIVRHFRPQRVVEIGSGNSSRVIAAALAGNVRNGGAAADYTIIDPYPGSQIRSGLPGVTHLLDKPVEELPTDIFDGLQSGDVLFVDSGHTVRVGGDVNFLILDVLPRLAAGVVVHFHDIPMPYEYPKVYATNPAFRVFWTETYLLQAFLAYNSDFEVLLAMNYLTHNHFAKFREAFPHYDPAVHRSGSGSFWIRRCRGQPACAAVSTAVEDNKA